MENTQYQPQAPQPAPEAAMPKTAMDITSLVLGIIAIVSSWMPIVNNLSALLALLGGIFGVIGVIAVIRGKKSGKVLAIVGLLCRVGRIFAGYNCGQFCIYLRGASARMAER